MNPDSTVLRLWIEWNDISLLKNPDSVGGLTMLMTCDLVNHFPKTEEDDEINGLYGVQNSIEIKVCIKNKKKHIFFVMTFQLCASHF